MSELVNRTELEEKLASAIARLEGRHKRELVDLLGDPPRIENITYSWWEDVSKDWRNLLTPELEKIYLQSAQAEMANAKIGVDWTLANEAAADWARNYTFNLVKDITKNTQAALQTKIGRYFQNQMTMGQLRDSLSSLYGPVRAQSIAVTEVTRAATAGELQITQMIEKDTGLSMVPVWVTSNDDIVCPVCAPRNGKVIKDNVFPPAHVSCRCWIRSELPKGKYA